MFKQPSDEDIIRIEKERSYFFGLFSKRTYVEARYVIAKEVLKDFEKREKNK